MKKIIPTLTICSLFGVNGFAEDPGESEALAGTNYDRIMSKIVAPLRKASSVTADAIVSLSMTGTGSEEIDIDKYRVKTAKDEDRVVTR